jgi:endogenous inhibitor of DNA gyrase (YacG/DUF329 family)
MSDKKRACPYCSKKSAIEEFKLEYHKLGRQGKCPKCGKKVFMQREARGIIKDPKTGVARKRFRNT